MHAENFTQFISLEYKVQEREVADGETRDREVGVATWKASYVILHFWNLF